MTFMRTFLAFLGVIAGVFLLSRISYTSGFFHSIEAALSSSGSYLGRSFGRIVASEDSLAVRLLSCEEDRRLLSREAVEFARLEEENAELREMVGYKEASDRSGITARVIARSLPDEESHVILDKGEEDGIRVGETVIVGQGIVFGIIKSTTPHSSIATLLTSSESSVPAAILGKKKTVGLLEGRDGAVLSMQFIPREAGVTKGEVVVTSGLGGLIPEGLLLGTVTTVVDMESAPFAEALVEPLQDPLAWNMVLVLPLNGS
jgi:rod shape-determining protein MreC